MVYCIYMYQGILCHDNILRECESITKHGDYDNRIMTFRYSIAFLVYRDSLHVCRSQKRVVARCMTGNAERASSVQKEERTLQQGEVEDCTSTRHQLPYVAVTLGASAVNVYRKVWGVMLSFVHKQLECHSQKTLFTHATPVAVTATYSIMRLR